MKLFIEKRSHVRSSNTIFFYAATARSYLLLARSLKSQYYFDKAKECMTMLREFKCKESEETELITIKFAA